MFGLSLSNDDWLLLSLLFFLFAVALTFYYAWAVKKDGVLDPISVFLFFYCLFVLPLPVRSYITKEIVGDVTDHLPGLLPYMPWAVFLSAVGLPFFVWGYYSKLSQRIARRLPRPRAGIHSRTAFVLLTTLSLVLLSLLARNEGGLLNFILLGYGSTAEMFGKGYLAVGLPWLFIASLFLLYGYALRHTRSDLIFFIGAVFAVAIIHVVLGSRGILMYMGLTVLIYWNAAVKPISAKLLTAIGVTCFIGLNLLGIVRSSNYSSLSDVWARSSAVEGSKLDNNVLYTLSIGEFVVPFETLPQMAKSVGTEIRPQLGLTYLRAPLYWIPAAIYPSRPIPLSTWYMEKFYGGGYGANQGRAFFFTAEGYLNFGFLGVLGVMLMWGWFLGAVHQYRIAAGGEPGALMLYALTVAFIFRGIAGDFVSMFAGLPEQSLSAAVLGIWVVNWGRGRQRVWRRTPAASRTARPPSAYYSNAKPALGGNASDRH
ncbi:MAG TPA: hypothetical protein VNE63_14300 [Candidatus Acidoferrales bacterium]|nr:hypothetical protein [Candidatus Acidoferrales bacterium]